MRWLLRRGAPGRGARPGRGGPAGVGGPRRLRGGGPASGGPGQGRRLQRQHHRHGGVPARARPAPAGGPELPGSGRCRTGRGLRADSATLEGPTPRGQGVCVWWGRGESVCCGDAASHSPFLLSLLYGVLLISRRALHSPPVARNGTSLLLTSDVPQQIASQLEGSKMTAVYSHGLSVFHLQMWECMYGVQCFFIQWVRLRQGLLTTIVFLIQTHSGPFLFNMLFMFLT